MIPHPRDLRPLILLTHKDPLIRLGLSMALQQAHFGSRVRAAAPDCGDFDSLVDSADIVVTDYEHALTLCACVKKGSWGYRPSAPKVMVVSYRQGEHEIRTAVSAGVMGYLFCGSALDEFVEATQSLLNDARYLTGSAIRKFAESMMHEDLTPRELEVLMCLVNGKVNKQICDELAIALGTVKSHIKSIFTKFGVVTRTQAVRVALQRGVSSVGHEARQRSIATPVDRSRAP